MIDEKNDVVYEICKLVLVLKKNVWGWNFGKKNVTFLRCEQLFIWNDLRHHNFDVDALESLLNLLIYFDLMLELYLIKYLNSTLKTLVRCHIYYAG